MDQAWPRTVRTSVRGQMISWFVIRITGAGLPHVNFRTGGVALGLSPDDELVLPGAPAFSGPGARTGMNQLGNRELAAQSERELAVGGIVCVH